MSQHDPSKLRFSGSDAPSRLPSPDQEPSSAIPGQREYLTLRIREKLRKSELRFYLVNLVVASLAEEFMNSRLEAIFSSGVIA